MLTECEGCGDKTSQALTPCDECDRAVCEECSTGTSYCRSCYEDRLYCCEDCTRTMVRRVLRGRLAGPAGRSHP